MTIKLVDVWRAADRQCYLPLGNHNGKCQPLRSAARRRSGCRTAVPSQWGLVPTIVFGAFAALMAMLPLAVVAGFVFSLYYAVPDNFETFVPSAERHNTMLNAPYVKLVVVLIWVVGMVVGGFVRVSAVRWQMARCFGRRCIILFGHLGHPVNCVGGGQTVCYTVDHHRSTSSGSER